MAPEDSLFPVSSSCFTRMSYFYLNLVRCFIYYHSFCMFGYLYGTESVQAGSAKISKTLAPLNIHFYLWLFKVFIFQCYTQEWWISCSKLEQPNPCSFLLVRICTSNTEYFPLETPVPNAFKKAAFETSLQYPLPLKPQLSTCCILLPSACCLVFQIK